MRTTTGQRRRPLPRCAAAKRKFDFPKGIHEERSYLWKPLGGERLVGWLAGPVMTITVDQNNMITAPAPVGVTSGASILSWLAPMETPDALLFGISNRELDRFPVWRSTGEVGLLKIEKSGTGATWTLMDVSGSVPRLTDLDQSSVAMALWTTTPHLVFVNSALKKTLAVRESTGGVRPEALELLLMPTVDDPSDLSSPWPRAQAGLVAKSVISVDPPQTNRAGRQMEASYVPFFAHGRVVAILTILKDLTEAVREALGREWQGTWQMAASITHEVRNPLATVRGFLQLMEGEAQGQIRKWCELSIREVDRVSRILEDFVAVSGPDADKPEPVFLGDIAQGVVDALRMGGKWPEGSVLQSVHSEIIVWTDRAHLTQILLNLVSNGLEAGPPVRIASEHKGTSVIVKVTDSGPGIADSVYSRMFEPFYTTKSYGSGLGLHICQTLARRIGAVIQCEPKVPDGGAEFSVILPLEANATPI